jgi:hypothetical protein
MVHTLDFISNAFHKDDSENLLPSRTLPQPP